jgi:hypothetical protein
MNQLEWETTSDPFAMVRFVAREAGARKLRLLACACCRHTWNQFVTPLTIRIVTAAEACADCEISDARLVRVHQTAERVAQEERDRAQRDGFGYLSYTAEAVAHATYSDAAAAAEFALRASALAAIDAPTHGPVLYRARSARDMPRECQDELAAQADLARDIFGNPFQSSEIQFEWLTSTVVALARGIYANRAFDRMPILADALQDAGCDDDAILSHCREPREHARGCWVVDLLLGKQ